MYNVGQFDQMLEVAKDVATLQAAYMSECIKCGMTRNEAYRASNNFVMATMQPKQDK